MAELNGWEYELDGLMLNASNGIAVLETSGLEDSADLDQDTAQNSGDGTSQGHMRLSDRAPTITLGWHEDTTEAQKDAVRQRMAPPTNRLAGRTLRWRGRPGPVEAPTLTRRVQYTPAPGRSMSVPGDYVHLNYGFADGVVLRLQCNDPVIYSDAIEEVEVETATPGSAFEFDVTNAGSLATITGAPPGSSLGVYQFEIVAGGGGCTWPFLRNVDHMDEFVYLAEELGAAGVFSVSWDRTARRNVTIRYAEVKGPDTSPIPFWPVIRPGVNTFEIGCTAGSVTGTFEYRSTW